METIKGDPITVFDNVDTQNVGKYADTIIDCREASGLNVVVESATGFIYTLTFEGSATRGGRFFSLPDATAAYTGVSGNRTFDIIVPSNWVRVLFATNGGSATVIVTPIRHTKIQILNGASIVQGASSSDAASSPWATTLEAASGATGAASRNFGAKAVLRSAASVLLNAYVINTTGAAGWLQIFDAATEGTVTLGTTVPVREIQIPANDTKEVPLGPLGIKLTAGLVAAITTGEFGATAVGSGFHLFYGYR